VEIVGGVPYDVLAKEFENADSCVFPSDWEASGYVCLEAMAAARGVIGSSAGGMAEIIEHGRTGLLVPPRNPRAIADAILTLLRDPERRIAMGRAAREYVTTAYSPDAIGPLQEASYMRAIERAKARCAA
jgi:glycosyltransferase involved in cell wall biosynthesis